MYCLLSITVTVAVLFLVLLSALFVNKKVSKKQARQLKEVCNMIVYSLLVFVFMLLYLFVVLLFDEIKGGINPLGSAILLVIAVLGASQLASLGMYSKQERQKSDGKKEEKKFAVFVSSCECAWLFCTLAAEQGTPELRAYFWMSLAIIVGFFVSIDTIVDNISIIKMLKNIWADLFSEKSKRIKKGLIVIPSVVLTLVVVLAFKVREVISEEVRSAVDIGMALGCIFFVILILVLLHIPRVRKRFDEKFIGQKK